MSSRNPFSTADAKTAIEQVGIFVVKDADDRSSDATDREGKKVIGKGNRFAQFYNNGYPIRTPEGLEFVYKNTMGDEQIGSVIISIIEKPRWGYSRFFSTRLSADYAWFFAIRDKKKKHEAIHTLIVQFWMPGSRVTFYEGSHLQYFDAEQDKDNFGVLNTPRAEMNRKGIVSNYVDMPNGGYRLGWTYEGGEGFMNLGIAEDEEVRIWRPMEVPDTQAIRAKVAELEGLGFRTKISYVNK
ncbi:unnamed protein product [Clonostachys chloroleuca]|uniref:Uncharacterized protein n=2 Tax=Clonostachys chloroleuca TaxID=1926264 RepID=A0AA35LY85_9HYPO|nr:unnamed protein product [Clonostachys chloroleuca]CAI6085964.1 unnamed protein product [Clonostachys chloroleuca]